MSFLWFAHSGPESIYKCPFFTFPPKLKSNLGAITIGIYVSRLPDMSIARDMFATIHGSVMPEETVFVSSQDECVLAVDLEAAWKSVGLKAGYSNEVELKFYIGLGNIDSESS